MLWKIYYVIDDGHDWHEKVCIIKADSKDEAQEILYYEIALKLTEERKIVNVRIIKIAKCKID